MKLMPQEIEVRFILPSIRKELSLELQKKGLKQVEISKLLGITPAAVSQYLKQKRGNTCFTTKLQSEVKRSATRIIKNPEFLQKEVYRITNEVKKSGFICEIHKKHDKVPVHCDICFVR
jgi:uncharacterized protein